MSYTFGADPELFVFDKDTNKFVSSHDFLPGTKQAPFKVEYGAVQVDGVAAEFNIDPSDNFKDFKRNIVAVRQQMLEIIQKNGGKNLTLVAKPTATFDQAYFDALPARTKELGCEPDYCGWKRGVNARPDAGNRPFRTGGGHVHIGWGIDVDPMEPTHFNDCCVLAKNLYSNGGNMDYLWDGDKKRRQLYGSRYSFRPKSFGMEYRYFSNAWVDDFDAMKFVWNLARNTVENLDSKFGGKEEARYRPTTNIPIKFQRSHHTSNRVYSYMENTLR